MGSCAKICCLNLLEEHAINSNDLVRSDIAGECGVHGGRARRILNRN